MKYPYIGKSKHENGKTVLFLKQGSGFDFSDCSCEVYVFWKEDMFTNITREHLEGKRVKVISPEHGEFVQKLAFNAGFDWASDLEKNNLNTGVFIYFGKDGLLWVTYSAKVEEITIPLPPESKPKDEWPKVGDIVTWGSCVANVEVVATHNKTAWVLDEYGSYDNVEIAKLKNPKTEAEILRDDIATQLEAITGNTLSKSGTWLQSISLAMVENKISGIEITKNPQ